MSIPQQTTNKGNGSVVTSQSVSQSYDQVSKRDSFQENLDRTEKPVEDNLLYYPEDLFRTPEYRFGIQFDIYDASGQVISENRSVTKSQSDINNASSGGIAGSVAQTRDNIKNGVSAETSKVLEQTSQSSEEAIESTKAGLMASLESLVTSEKKYDPKGRDSFVESVVGVKNNLNKVATVYMYLPGTLSFSSSFEYEDADLSAIDIIKSVQAAGGYSDNPEAMGEIIRKGSLAAVNLTSLPEGGKELAQNLSKVTSRQVENPFLVHLFKGVTRREFTFDFTMVPRSPKEVRNVQAIVQTFRKFSHPGRSPGGRFLDFPAEFDLKFIYMNEKTGSTIAVPKIKKCALKSIKVDYGENIFAAIRGSGPAQATQVKMSLQFSELMILARQEIEEGF